MNYEQLVSPLYEFFNQGADKQLGSRKRDSEGNIEMTKWDYVTGRTQKELNDAAKKRLLDSSDAERYTVLTRGDVVPENMRSGQLKQDIKRLEDLDLATKQYLATKNNQGRGALEGLSTDAEVFQKLNELNSANQKADDEAPGGRIERMEESDRRYYDGLEKSDKLLAANMALQSGQLALANTRADNQMQIAQMNNQLQMRRQDSQDRRADRRDRQAMIQQLMGGLSALGTSIAI